LYAQLLEWMPASPTGSNIGLDEYVLAISEAVATITTAAQGAKPALIGHSLGGTLAAIYGAFLPESIRSLVLLGAPLCFEPSKNQFRDALVSFGSIGDFRYRSISRLTPVTRKRVGISRRIRLVAPDGRCDEHCRPPCNGNSCASGTLGT
jgi:pimeloyl-ACP methyl ester carboxylesterase